MHVLNAPPDNMAIQQGLHPVRIAIKTVNTVVRAQPVVLFAVTERFIAAITRSVRMPEAVTKPAAVRPMVPMEAVGAVSVIPERKIKDVQTDLNVMILELVVIVNGITILSQEFVPPVRLGRQHPQQMPPAVIVRTVKHIM